MNHRRGRPDHGDGERFGARRMHRDPANGLIFGVCAGMADYFGFDPTPLRVVTAVLLVFFMPGVLVIYLALALLLPKRPADAYRSDEDEGFRRELHASPRATLSGVRHRFRELELRLQRLERYVTSQRFELDREFRDLARERRG